MFGARGPFYYRPNVFYVLTFSWEGGGECVFLTHDLMLVKALQLRNETTVGQL